MTTHKFDVNVRIFHNFDEDSEGTEADLGLYLDVEEIPSVLTQLHEFFSILKECSFTSFQWDYLNLNSDQVQIELEYQEKLKEKLSSFSWYHNFDMKLINLKLKNNNILLNISKILEIEDLRDSGICEFALNLTMRNIDFDSQKLLNSIKESAELQKNCFDQIVKIDEEIKIKEKQIKKQSQELKKAKIQEEKYKKTLQKRELAELYRKGLLSKEALEIKLKEIK